jgi:hypothetical protein
MSGSKIEVVEDDNTLDVLRQSILFEINAIDDHLVKGRLKRVLPKVCMNGTKSYPPGSPAPSFENKNENYIFAWKVAYVLAMQYPTVKQ